ncbi:hypothetical protein YPPY92_2949, partial [Yersinia pestis PY-92]
MPPTPQQSRTGKS